MGIGSALGRSTLVGLVSVLVAMVVVMVLLVGATVAQIAAVGSTMPGGGDPLTFFLGGAWIDLAIVILIAFASGFLFTFRRLHSTRRAGL